MQNPLVTAVIPTRNRPELVLRAVRSALGQTYANLEVVVVIDGPDPTTNAALETISDKRLRVLALDQSVGGSDARNKGVQHARGQWIAFLDDDDEWMPEKTEKQINAAAASGCESPLVCSQVVARTPVADFIWPETAPRKPYSEYLLVRSRLSYGEGLMQTSTLMAKRKLLEQVPFRTGLRKHQDWDWVLRCTELNNIEVIFLHRPLAILHLEQNRLRVSHENMWRFSFEWIKEVKKLVTRRAYASFIATYVAPQAADEKAWGVFFPLFYEMFRRGSPRLRDLGVFIGAWLVPLPLRDALRRLMHIRAAAWSRRA